MEDWLRFVAEQMRRPTLTSQPGDSRAAVRNPQALSSAANPSTDVSNDGSMPLPQETSEALLQAGSSSSDPGTLSTSFAQGGPVRDQQAALQRMLADLRLASTLSYLPNAGVRFLAPQDQLALELLRNQPQVMKDQALSTLQARQEEATVVANLRQQESLGRLPNDILAGYQNLLMNQIYLSAHHPLLVTHAPVAGAQRHTSKHAAGKPTVGKKREASAKADLLAVEGKEPKTATRQGIFTSSGSFPGKLYQLLAETEASGKADIVSFTPLAPGFRIHQKERFQAEIAPKYFSPWDMEWFHQQLWLHNFTKTSDLPRDVEGYSHQYFTRGRPDLLHNIALRSPAKLNEARLPHGKRKQAPALMEGRSRHGHEPFPEKLFRMLEESEKAGLDHIVSFTVSGRAFRIHNPEAFVEEIAPKYFRHRKLDSFRRQLNLYGFSRVFRGPDRGAYRHENFRKGRPDLLYRIRIAPKDSQL